MVSASLSSRGLACGLLLAAVAVAALAPTSAGASGPGSSPSTGPPGTVGSPSVRNDSAGFSGTYVAGDLPPAGAALANFSVVGTPVFREVAVNGYTRQSVALVQGTIVVRGSSAELRVVDALAAYMTLDVIANATVLLTPSAGSSFAPDPSGALRVTAGSLRGLLWATCATTSLAVSGESAVLPNATRGCAVHFRADTTSDVIASGEIAEAIAASSLAAEVSIAEVGGDTPPAIQLYAPVEVAVTALPQRVVVAISGSLPAGRSVLVILPRQVIEAGVAIDARYDGRSMAVASSVRDALNASDDGGVAEFFVFSEGNLTAIVLTVPSFSTHIAEIGVASPAPAGPLGIPSGDFAIAGTVGAAVTLLAGATLFWPRRRA